MIPKVSRIDKSQEYLFRKPRCGCCSKHIPSVECESDQNYLPHKWYNSKYIAPIAFGILVLGTSLMSECHRNQGKTSLETRANTP